MNYALQSGLAAGETAIEACRCGAFSADVMARYTEYLNERKVFPDFRSYRHSPAFINGERLQNLYPDLVAHGMEALFRVDGTGKHKLLPLMYKTLRHYRVKPRHVLHDLYQAARAYLW
jgi:electron transfer flavoprotein-quinone oxidoreductase